MAELRTIARPYARAAFASAQAHDEIDIWRQALSALKQIATNRSLRSVLNGPRRLSRRIVEEALLALESDGRPPNGRIRQFLMELALRRRLPLLVEIHDLFEHDYAVSQGRTQVEIVSAQTLSTQEKAMLSEVLQKRLGQSIDATYRVDEALWAGMIVRVGDKVVDGSIKSRFEKLISTLLESDGQYQSGRIREFLTSLALEQGNADATSSVKKNARADGQVADGSMKSHFEQLTRVLKDYLRR